MKVKICIKQKIPLILHSLFRLHPIYSWERIWRDGRVVDCNGLENRRTETYRGFESLSLRHPIFIKSLIHNGLATFIMLVFPRIRIFVTFVAKSPIIGQYDFSSEQFKSRSSITFPFLVFQPVILSLDDTVSITVFDGVLYRVYVIEQPVPK